MAGTINFAMTQQFDMDGRPLSGGFLFFFVAGTTTPQSAFQDIALTIPWPNPIVLDASGRVPMFYLADGNIKIRLTTEAGVTVIAADNLLVIGPSTGGGGGGGQVDATTVLQTGDIKGRYGTGPLDGFVRCNGNSIGKTGSGATERADTDLCRALFEYLWIFPNITLDTPKGASATADFDAGRKLNLPDLRGRLIAGMDDMGAPSAGRLTATFFNNATVLGNVGGAQSVTLAAGNIPNHTHTQQGAFGTTVELQSFNHNFSWSGVTGINNESIDHTHGYTDSFFSGANSTAPGGNPPGGSNQSQGANTGGSSIGHGNHAHSYSGSGVTGVQNQNHTHNVTISGETGGMIGAASVPFTNVQPAMVLTFYMKL